MGALPEAGLSWLDKEALETELKYAGVAGRQAKMQVSLSKGGAAVGLQGPASHQSLKSANVAGSAVL